MSDPLATYLHDHLAGSVQAVELVKLMRDEYAGESMGDFAASILIDIEADQQTLRTLAGRAGAGSSGIKELTTWLAEKLTRLKLGRGAGNGLATFEALEFLELGIHGKWALWHALAVVAKDDPRLQGINFDDLVARAESQRVKVDGCRLELARTALRNGN